MAPLLDIALQKAGTNWTVPSRMLQKNLVDSKNSLGEIQHVGDFVVGHNTELANLILDNQSTRFFQLLENCVDNYRKPSEPLKMNASTKAHSLTCHLTTYNNQFMKPVTRKFHFQVTRIPLALYFYHSDPRVKNSRKH